MTTARIQRQSYNESVRASYAAQEARRALGDLPPNLLRDVLDFANSGKPAKRATVVKWLSTRGTWGYVDLLVADILRYQQLAHASLAAV